MSSHSRHDKDEDRLARSVASRIHASLRPIIGIYKSHRRMRKGRIHRLRQHMQCSTQQPSRSIKRIHGLLYDPRNPCRFQRWDVSLNQSSCTTCPSSQTCTCSSRPTMEKGRPREGWQGCQPPKSLGTTDTDPIP